MGSATAGLLAVAIGGALGYGLSRHRRAGGERDAAARRLYQGAALLSFSVLADSALEHYRSYFSNRAMFVAPTVAAFSLAAAARGGLAPRATGRMENAAFAAAAMTGVIGTGFHVYNVGKREGGLSWGNLFYAAPIGAPSAISIAGLLGLAAGRVAATPNSERQPMLLGYPAGRGLGWLASFGLIGASAEAWLLHFRGAFQNPFMYAPVVGPPLAAAALAVSASAPTPAATRTTRALLGGTALMGLAGVGFHAYGISRNMGGWRNWSQMLFQGPPLPAPPSFTGMALAGLGALRLLEDAR